MIGPAHQRQPAQAAHRPPALLVFFAVLGLRGRRRHGRRTPAAPLAPEGAAGGLGSRSAARRPVVIASPAHLAAAKDTIDLPGDLQAMIESPIFARADGYLAPAWWISATTSRPAS